MDKMVPKTTVPSYGHHSLSCDVANGTQIITMGGTFPNSSGYHAPSVGGTTSILDKILPITHLGARLF